MKNTNKSMVIAVSNQKGGVGKSTTTLAMASSLARRKKNVLIIDMDAQGNTTRVAANAPVDTEQKKFDIFDVLDEKATAADAIRPANSAINSDTPFGTGIIAAGKRLASADIQIITEGKEYILRDALEPIKEDYDYIIIDTPPHIGVLMANALTAADGVIIPANAEPFGLQGISQIKPTIDRIKKRCNAKLTTLGILLTRHKANTRLMDGLIEDAGRVAADMGTNVYKTLIRESVVVKEAQAERRPLVCYRGGAGVTSDYENFVEEFLAQLRRLS